MIDVLSQAEEALKQHEHMLNSNLFKQRDQIAEDIAENETEQLDSKGNALSLPQQTLTTELVCKLAHILW